MAVCNFEYFVALAKSVKYRINQCSGIIKLALRNQRRNPPQGVNALRIKIELFFSTFLLKLELVRLARGIDGTFFTHGSRTLAIWLQLR
jgi:hypothetical protein